MRFISYCIVIPQPLTLMTTHELHANQLLFRWRIAAVIKHLRQVIVSFHQANKIIFFHYYYPSVLLFILQWLYWHSENLLHISWLQLCCQLKILVILNVYSTTLKTNKCLLTVRVQDGHIRSIYLPFVNLHKI